MHSAVAQTQGGQALFGALGKGAALRHCANSLSDGVSAARGLQKAAPEAKWRGGVLLPRPFLDCLLRAQSAAAAASSGGRDQRAPAARCREPEARQGLRLGESPERRTPRGSGVRPAGRQENSAWFLGCRRDSLGGFTRQESSARRTGGVAPSGGEQRGGRELWVGGSCCQSAALEVWSPPP